MISERTVKLNVHIESIHSLLVFMAAIILSFNTHCPCLAQRDAATYPGGRSPGRIPEVFAPGIVSTVYGEFAGTFTPDMEEYYFTRRGPFPGGIAQIMVMKKTEAGWSEPEVAPFCSGTYEFEPFVTSDGQRLYFGSRRSPGSAEAPGTMRQWYVEREGDTWSTPQPAGAPFIDRMVMYPSITADGTFYFTDMDGIYYSEYKEKMYRMPVRLGGEINFLPRTAHAFLPQDGAYLIFDGQPRGEGKSDLYISYRKSDGTWTKGKDMGPEINSGKSQAIASVSPDGRSLFFTRNGDIYWMDAGIIDEIRMLPAFTISADSGSAPLAVTIAADPATVPDSIIAFAWDFENDGFVDANGAAPGHTYTEPGFYSIQMTVYTAEDTLSRIIQDAVRVTSREQGGTLPH